MPGRIRTDFEQVTPVTQISGVLRYARYAAAVACTVAAAGVSRMKRAAAVIAAGNCARLTGLANR